MKPIITVSQKMDEVWNVVVGTKSSVDDLVPKSDELLTQTQRQERAIGEIHNDLRTKTNKIIANLDKDDVAILAQKPVPAEVLLEPNLEHVDEYESTRYVEDYATDTTLPVGYTTISPPITQTPSIVFQNHTGGVTTTEKKVEKRKGGIIFPSVKNKPTHVNSTFITSDVSSSSKDVKGEIIWTTIQLYHDIDFILRDGGFLLNKWVSNHPALISHITSDKPESIINIGTDEETHSLGLLWLSKQDYLTFQINFELVDKPSTKRPVLYTIARVFDPLGILAPIVVKAKIILQNIWKLHLGWDESLPLSLHTEWQNIYNSLAHINDERVSRYMLCDIPKRIELHGFADASEKAFGACTYILVQSTKQSRVAPVKPVTIPRLELCAALFLAQLYDKVISSWNGNIDAVYLWNDSTATIGWLRGSPQQWKVFMANRVSEIQTLTKIECWRHVTTHNNPADILSRGINPENIVNCRLWWQGPTWLSETDDFWPMPTNELNPISCQLEARKISAVIACFHLADELRIFERCSSFSKLCRVIAFMIRFRYNCTNKKKLQLFLHIKTKKPIGKGKLLKFNPYLDKDDILRVGGRLNYSDLPFEHKHLIILDSKHRFTNLMVSSEHTRLLHAGPQLLLANIREKYWILGGRNLVRRITQLCYLLPGETRL
nr:unnamed protein product [Callosobruchus analis]